VLLICLWVRSYWCEDYIGYNYELEYGFGSRSSKGRMTFVSYDARAYTGIDRIATKGFYLKSFDASEAPPSQPKWDFGLKGAHSPSTYLTVPHWSLALVFAVLALINPLSRIPRRFSLRTLLIATTLAAAGLGTVAWLRR
jgi:hypothetical protein